MILCRIPCCGYLVSRLQSFSYFATVKLRSIFCLLVFLFSDIPEVLGTAIALKLLFGMRLWVGTLVTSVSVLVFLAVSYFGIRYAPEHRGAQRNHSLSLERHHSRANEAVLFFVSSFAYSRCALVAYLLGRLRAIRGISVVMWKRFTVLILPHASVSCALILSRVPGVLYHTFNPSIYVSWKLNLMAQLEGEKLSRTAFGKVATARRVRVFYCLWFHTRNLHAFGAF